ncbi:MAG: c-type cytochrome [Pseudohongiellaceae bacterium]|nr:c-type cytochrome [Pseudohongiellaceae bacterium]
MSSKFKLVVLALSLVLGCALVLLALSVREGSMQTSERAASVEYGEFIIRNTAQVLGSGQSDPALQYSGTNMACASCHLESGQLPGTLSLLQAAAKYPSFSGREGRDRDLEDRINGCMQRSMNGLPIPREGVEMQSMVSYITHLGQRYQAMSKEARELQEPPSFVEPQRKASVENGALVYEQRCQTCHGDNGQGLLATQDASLGYTFPPLWGPDSYNNGAGMTRVLTAARFIKARMPLGQPDLSDDEAYDVAAYINSHERPIKANLEADYPDKSRKPIDSPYPPYADPFSQEQHRLGPFAPIREYYQNR